MGRADPTARVYRVLLAAAGVAVLSVIASTPATASGRTSIEVQDRCDPATFNAFIPGLCAPTPRGNVTLEAFLDTLNPDDGGHGAWRNSREETHIDEGQHVHVVNTGGEVHSFTEVVDFGGGVVPDLDAALPPGTPSAQPVGDPGPSFFGPGGRITVTGLIEGEHRFQCLIHPWMRTVIEVRG